MQTVAKEIRKVKRKIVGVLRKGEWKKAERKEWRKERRHVTESQTLKLPPPPPPSATSTKLYCLAKKRGSAIEKRARWKINNRTCLCSPAASQAGPSSPPPHTHARTNTHSHTKLLLNWSQGMKENYEKRCSAASVGLTLLCWAVRAGFGGLIHCLGIAWPPLPNLTWSEETRLDFPSSGLLDEL